MIYKIVGDTGAGKCSCGHRVKKYEEYFILAIQKYLYSHCSKCVSEKSGFNTIKVPEALENDCIPIK